MKQKYTWKTVSVGLGLFVVLGFLSLPISLVPPTTPVAPITTQESAQKDTDETKLGTLRLSSIRTDTPQEAASQETTVTSESMPKPRVVPIEKMVTIDNKQYPLRTYAPLAMPNDPAANQWWVYQSNLTAAWDIPRGSHETLIAIIDTGFGLQHEELSQTWYTNSGETGLSSAEGVSVYNCTDQGKTLDASCNLVDDDVDGILDNETGSIGYENPSRLTCSAQSRPITKDCNRLDDDTNGYIDDFRGWDFINHDNSTQAGQLSPNGTGTTHGTMVAGIAAANRDNSKGIAGVDEGARILPLQAIDDDSYGDTRSVGRSIRYAAQMGADIISLSLGSSLPDPYVQESVHFALTRGSIVVAASGNDGCDCMLYPANYPEVLSVGALDATSSRAAFSSWGANLDLLAPGANMTTPTWTSSNGSSLYATGVNGTSFATPFVSGVLSRLLSHQPTATPLQLRAMLTENTNKLNLGSAKRNNTIGFGTVDASKANTRAVTPEHHNILYALSPTSQGNFLDKLTPKEPVSSGWVYDCQAGNPSTPVYELKKSGSHFFSASESEVYIAKTQGYTASTFALTCMQQPHDRPVTVRNLNIFSEFRNIQNRK